MLGLEFHRRHNSMDFFITVTLTSADFIEWDLGMLNKQSAFSS
jgi:hypothetical protein